MLPQVAVVNTYGPTEASIGSIFHEITDADTGSIPIGSPIDNTYAVIVDDELRPVASGGTGEILLGGDCLGLGYLNDPDRTRAAFIDNPFPGIPGSRLYRTGDLGRYLPGGLLHFAGRRDQQVKISGMRVELPEIELALLRHPLVREAKVIVRDGAGGRWLVAFVTVTQAARPDPGDLRAFAGEELSPQLVPKEFIILDQMPMNANGKADRRELARLAEQRHLASVPVSASQPGGAEWAVWQAWQDLLPVPPSSPADDFFDLGGDSLTAQRLALRLSRELGVAVSIRDLADHATIAQQAALVSGAGTIEHDTVRDRLDEDARLPADIVPADIVPADIAPAAQPVGGLDRVLLTGSTGFVGAHLLYDMLTSTTAEIWCLVRADSADDALSRVTGNLAEYRLWEDDFAGRVHVWPGDLGQPQFGLDAGTYELLGRGVDAVVHNGALVNLVRGYSAHRAANVTGTVEILRFATAFGAKPVHYISTLSTVVDRSAEPAPEAPVPLRPPSGGYGQSKWVAERLLGQAAERGVAVTVYRLGEMMPHSRTGVPSRRGLPDLLAKACLRLGLCFSSPITMNYTPVDYASRLVVTAIARGETGYFHVRHPEPVRFDDLLTALQAEFGLTHASYRQFWTAMRDLADVGADEEVSGTLALVPDPDDESEASGLAALFGDDLSAFSSTDRTDALMADAGIRWPPIGAEIFRQYAAHQRTRRDGDR
jgi:thioester reductase-like protein